MKKVLPLMLALALGFCLAACSVKDAVQNAVRDAADGGAPARGESTGSAAQPAPQDGAAAPGNNPDTGTVEGRLAKAGLTLEAVRPESFAEATLYNCDADEVVLYLSSGSDMLGAAVMQPMIEKILAATAAASDDGKNWEAYYGLGDPRELDMSETNYDTWYFIGQWSYRVKGQWVTVTLGVLPAEEPEGQDEYSWEVSMAFLY